MDQQTQNDNESQNNQERSHQYSEGQILKFIRVRFPGHAKSYPFMTGKRHYKYGQKVVALSDRGLAVGYVNSFPYEIEFKDSLMPIRTISKLATDDDEQESHDQGTKEREYEDLCKDLIKRHKLAMNLTHVELTGYGKKAVFYFTAPERVDFRGLVKDLVSELKMRIELRQISARERAAALGGLGPCGKELCCSTFLSRYGNVNIKMAKNQNLTLIPSKLNGLCGQLKCCTQFEEDVYKEKRTRLPEIGDFIQVANHDRGKVTKIHILIEQFDMLTDRGVIKRYNFDQYDKSDSRPPKDWKFPDRFQHISNETSKVIGLSDEHAEMSQRFMEEQEFDVDEYFSKDQGPEEVKANDSSDAEAPQEQSKEIKSQGEKDLERKRNKNNPFQKKGRRRRNNRPKKT